MAALKAREDTARRKAARRGFNLTKSRRRDPLAIDFGRFYLTPFDEGRPEHTFTSIEQVETFLDDPTNWSTL